ncbi:MAG: hypothetical protein OJF52_001182 [Nitrospira sp.]|nr:MAG: hypothetical protein OJF52_001182 [Nitrospira sp.]
MSAGDPAQLLQIGADLVRLYARPAVEVGLPRIHELSVVENRCRPVQRSREVTSTQADETQKYKRKRPCS